MYQKKKYRQQYGGDESRLKQSFEPKTRVQRTTAGKFVDKLFDSWKTLRSLKDSIPNEPTNPSNETYDGKPDDITADETKHGNSSNLNSEDSVSKKSETFKR